MDEPISNTADLTADTADDAGTSVADNGADTSTLAVDTLAVDTAPANEGTPPTRTRDEDVDKDINASRKRAESADDALDRAARAALANKGIEEIEEAYQNEPDEEDAEQKPKEPVAGVPTPKPGDLSEADANMLKRWALEADDLPKSPERRDKFLLGLRQRTEFTDRLASGQPQNQEGQEQQGGAGAGNGKGAANPADEQFDKLAEKHMKPLTEFFGEEVGTPFKQAVSGMFKEMFGQQVQAANAFYSSLEARDTEDGLSAARSNLKGVKLDDSAVTNKAWELILAKRSAEGQRYNPMQYNLRHAIPEAANLLYQQDAKKAAAVDLAKRGQQALRGSPARGTRTPTGTPKMSDDDRLTAAAAAAIQGKGAKAAQAAYEGRR